MRILINEAVILKQATVVPMRSPKQDEAHRIDLAEKKKAEQRARAAEPKVAAARDLTAIGGDLTTADLRDPGRRLRPAATAGRRA